MFSRRAQVPARSINEFSSRVALMQEQGRLRCDLTTSNPTRVGIEYDWRAIKSALGNAGFERYEPDSLGDVEARRRVVEYLAGLCHLDEEFCDSSVGQKPTVETTLLTASTSEAYSYLFKLLCEAGDSILVPTPSYPLIERLAAYESVNTVPYRLAYDGAWHVDRQSVVEAMQQRPRAIVVVSPNNPTGSCASSEELEFLAQFGVPVIIDQVFAPYVLRSNGPALARPRTETLMFVLDGLSKRCGLPQLKLGWVSVWGNAREVHEAMTALGHLADTYLSVNRPVEAVVGELLESTEGVRRHIRQRLARNLESLTTRTRDTCVSPLHYQGGWSAVLRLPAYRTDEEWAFELLEHGVLVQPGWLYDMPMRATVVLSLLVPCADFATGLDVLCDVCERA